MRRCALPGADPIYRDRTSTSVVPLIDWLLKLCTNDPFNF